MKIERRNAPTMNPRNTNQLRGLIERRQVAHLWGQRRFITPRLCGKVFGDGRKLLALSPIMFRPNRFVVRIGSRWSTSNLDCNNPMMPEDYLDDVYDAIEGEFVDWPWAASYGLRYTEDSDDELSSRITFRDGCEWWVMMWPRLRKTRSPARRSGAQRDARSERG